MAANTDDALRALQGRDWNGGEADRRGAKCAPECVSSSTASRSATIRTGT